MNYYTSIFSESRVVAICHYGEGAPLPAGTVMTIEFELQGRVKKAKDNEKIEMFFNNAAFSKYFQIVPTSPRHQCD